MKLGQNILSRVKTSFQLKQSNKSSQVLKNMPATKQSISPKVRVEPMIALKQKLGLRQSQQSRQSLIQQQILRTPTFANRFSPSYVKPFLSLPKFSLKLRGDNRKYFKVSAKPVKYVYTPTVEASFFKLRSLLYNGSPSSDISSYFQPSFSNLAASSKSEADW